MPHYKDGTPAQVGDVVKGTTYNRRGEVLGVVVSVTPGTDTCNCEVAAFLRKYGTTVVQDTGVDYGEAKAFERVM